MKVLQHFLPTSAKWFFCFVFAAIASGAEVAAADAKLEAQLVWGTNDEVTDTKYQPLDPALAKKLGMFKWKKYFLVNRQEIPLADQTQKVRLSPRCVIKVKQADEHRYEINVFGEGKHVRKITEKITKQDSLVIAGDDKNGCAWFILIREI